MAGEPDRHTHPEHAGASLRFDLQQGFPAVTTKKLAFKSAIGELVGFLRATRSAAEFRELGCKVWDQNANENAQWLANPYREGLDDLGPVYGVQWRQWPAYKVLDAGRPAQIADALARGYAKVADLDEGGAPKVLLYKAVDQLRQCLDTIHERPGDRRILFHGWNWAQIEEMALPPCHLLYQFLPNASTREISLCLYIRSNDVGLGTPFNLTEGAALLHLVGRLTGYTPRWFTYFIGDAHIYENHLPMLREQLSRTPFEAPAWCCRTASPTSRPLAATSRNGWSGSSRAISRWKAIRTTRRSRRRWRCRRPRALRAPQAPLRTGRMGPTPSAARSPQGAAADRQSRLRAAPVVRPCRIDGCRHGAWLLAGRPNGVGPIAPRLGKRKRDEADAHRGRAK